MRLQALAALARTNEHCTTFEQRAPDPAAIQLQNEDHSAVVQTWRLLNARIIKHTSGPMNARGTDVAMEEMVLAYERLEME